MTIRIMFLKKSLNWGASAVIADLIIVIYCFHKVVSFGIDVSVHVWEALVLLALAWFSYYATKKSKRFMHSAGYYRANGKWHRLEHGYLDNDITPPDHHYTIDASKITTETNQN